MTITRTISTLASINTFYNAIDVTTPDNELLTLINNMQNGIDSSEKLRFDQIASPSAPASGKNIIYFKSGDLPYMQGNSVTERMLGAMHLITARAAMGADATSVSISASVPQTFKHLLLYLEARTDLAATVDNLLLRFNADATAGNYYTQYAVESGSSVTAAEILGASTGIFLPNAAVGASGSAGNGGAAVLILNYTSATMRRVVHAECSALAGTTSGLVKAGRAKSFWMNTSGAITSITLHPSGGTNLKQNTAYALYGLN